MIHTDKTAEGAYNESRGVCSDEKPAGLGGLQMEKQKKVLVSMPKALLDKADTLLQHQKLSRSELIQRAVAFYLAHIQKQQLAAGYRNMAEINLELAENGVASDNDSLGLYEQKIGGV